MLIYTLLPFSIKNTETLIYNYIKFFKLLLLNKLFILIPNSIKFNKGFINFYIKKIKFNTNNIDLKYISYKSFLNPFYQISLPVKINILNNNKFNFNFKLFKFPKIDLEGNIICNGLKKIFISKIKRDSGLYFSKLKQKNSKISRASIIFNNNLFIIDLNYKNIIISDLVNKIEINFIIFLHYLGITNFDIIKYSKYGTSIFLKNLLKFNLKEYKLFKYQHFNYLHKLKLFSFYFGKISYNYNFISNLETNKILITFKNKWNLDNKFGFQIKNIFIYLYKDLINILDYLIDLKFNKKSIVDIDNFTNKTIETLPDLILNQLSIIIEKRLVFLITNINKLNRYSNIQFINFINNKKFIFNFKEQFNINPLIQYSDQINSLSEIMHKFKWIKSNKLHIQDINLRDIKSSEIGKLCLINTSEGLNSGLIVYLPQNSLIINNEILTPFNSQNNKKIKLLNFKSISSLNQEKKKIILTKNLIRKNKYFSTLNTIILYKNYLEKSNNSNLILFSEKELFSFAENLIPFIFHNDPTRSLMGAKMQMQSLPLIYNQKALISTETEQILSRKNNNIYSLQEGIIVFVSSYKIIVRDLLNREISYYLPNYKFSNQKTLINYIPIVWVGERVNLGQLLANSQELKDNEFSIGTNCFVMYGSYKGYEFEDALIINKQLIENNIFSSLHMDCYEISLGYNLKNFSEIITSKIPKYNKFIKRNLDTFGIIKESSKVLDKDLLCGKIKFYNLTLKQESLGYFLFNLFGYKIRHIKDTSILISLGNYGRVAKIEINSIPQTIKNLNLYLKLKIFIIKQRILEIGDKLCGRHGNKGVISHIANSIDLPYTKDSISPDIITTSLGVPSRMNVGQLYETLFGLSCNYLDKRLLIKNNLNTKLGSNYLKSLLYFYLKELNFYKGISSFNSYNFGKTNFFDGKTGKKIKGSILFGISFYTKLIHMVKDKIHYRTIGPYSIVTQQPIKSRSKQGGQRFGEMEVWALEAFGAAYNLKELFTLKSDNIKGRLNLQEYLLYNFSIKNVILSESFNLIIKELKSLALNIEALILI
uniref:DNA-directed RNA polymerase subunit beta n=1 Tax=Nephromyces sp. ex Molgula occidentalis TaxID=2544991 RepID=A0A5C1H7I2_9APIC|nr:plastid-encoded DNA-directed RNA polymerase beta [Nephromyces sp. ex Molgula occidentalis]